MNLQELTIFLAHEGYSLLYLPQYSCAFENEQAYALMPIGIPMTAQWFKHSDASTVVFFKSDKFDYFKETISEKHKSNSADDFKEYVLRFKAWLDTLL